MLDDGSGMGRRKQRRRTAAERASIVAESYEAGATVAMVARKHGIVASQLSTWRTAAKRKTGANLKRPVTKKPSKLKRGSKASKRRKSFCARMSGVKGQTSKKGKLTPKGAALKRWNC